MESLLSTIEAGGVILPHDLLPDDHPLVYNHRGIPVYEKLCAHDPPETGFVADARNLDRFIGLAVGYYNDMNGTDYVLCRSPNTSVYQRATFHIGGEGSYIHCAYDAAPSTDVSASKLFHFDFLKETDKVASCVILDDLGDCEYCRVYKPFKVANPYATVGAGGWVRFRDTTYESDKVANPYAMVAADEPTIVYNPVLGSQDNPPIPYNLTYGSNKKMILGTHDKPPILYNPTYEWDTSSGSDKKMVLGCHNKPPMPYNLTYGWDTSSGSDQMVLGCQNKPLMPNNPVLGSDKKMDLGSQKVVKCPMPNPIVSMLEKERFKNSMCVVTADPSEIPTPPPPFYSGDLATGVSLSDRAKLRLEFVLPPLAYYNKKQHTDYKLVDALPYCISWQLHCSVAHGNFIAKEGDGPNKLFFAEHEKQYGVWVVVGCHVVRGKTTAGCLRCTKSKWARQVIHPTRGFRHGLFHSGRKLDLPPRKSARY